MMVWSVINLVSGNERSMETLAAEVWDTDQVHLNNRNISCLTPEVPSCPILVKLFLQENRTLAKIPPSLFENMLVLQVLDLSRTSIQSLPPSISKLSLLEEFILRECSLLMELPPEIGALESLKLFDLEGTEIMYLPEEIGKLENLECLRVSLCPYADDYKERNGISHIIPRKTVSKLAKLKELSILVNPDAEWWEVEVLEGILEELLVLNDLETLKLYLPTAKLLQRFLQFERYQMPLCSTLLNFRLITGHVVEQLTSCLPFDVEQSFERFEKCLKYINGEGSMDEMAELIKNARALYLCRHWTIEKLSVFDISELNYCLLMECNEMQTVVHQEESREDRNEATDDEKVVLGSLQYLGIHFMKKLQRIWRGPMGRNSLSCLRILALHTCPELTTVLTGCMLDNLQTLTEIIVEDCPKVKSLITLKTTLWSPGPFLPNLRKIFLLDLPELVSISSGVLIAPELESLLIFNCVKLDYLSVMEIPRDVKEIRGEIEWWDALKYGKLTWSNVFLELKRDGRLMDQLAEDTNSLQHFHKLQMISPHPAVGSSFCVDQNSSRDHPPESNYMHSELTDGRDREWLNVPSCEKETPKILTQKILYSNNSKVNEGNIDGQSQHAGTSFRTYLESSRPTSESPHDEDSDRIPSQNAGTAFRNYWESSVPSGRLADEGIDSDRNLKDPNHKFGSTKKKIHSSNVTKWTQVKVNKGTGLEVIPPEDGYTWRKYRQREFLHTRSYYRCNYRVKHGCMARKLVQRSNDDPSTFEITYIGMHTCPRDVRSCFSSTSTATLSSASTITANSSELPDTPEQTDVANESSKL